jgi:hypothetical protein
VDQVSIKNEITSKITEYLLNIKRRDKIPKSDLIALIENINGVDSVNLSFVSSVNERAIIDGFYVKRSNRVDRIRGLMTVQTKKVILEPNADPSLGLDEFGDIVIGLNELPLVRGGWYDRFGNYYEDGLNTGEFSSLNIIIKDVIRESLSVRMMNRKKDSMK